MEHDPENEETRHADETRPLGQQHQGEVVPAPRGGPAEPAMGGVIVPVPPGGPPMIPPGRRAPGNRRRGPATLIIVLTVVVFAMAVTIMVLVTRGGTAKTAVASTPTHPAATAARSTGSSSAGPTTGTTPGGSSEPSATGEPPSVGANPVPGRPGSTFLGDAIDSSGNVSSNQDELISGKDYPNSTTIGCPTGGQPDDWSAAEYRSFSAMVGVADNQSNAEGETVTVTFYDQDRRVLSTARTSVGHPQNITVPLKNAARLALTCSVSPSGAGFDITLGNAALNP